VEPPQEGAAAAGSVVLAAAQSEVSVAADQSSVTW